MCVCEREFWGCKSEVEMQMQTVWELADEMQICKIFMRFFAWWMGQGERRGVSGGKGWGEGVESVDGDGLNDTTKMSSWQFAADPSGALFTSRQALQAPPSSPVLRRPVSRSIIPALLRFVSLSPGRGWHVGQRARSSAVINIHLHIFKCKCKKKKKTQTDKWRKLETPHN